MTAVLLTLALGTAMGCGKSKADAAAAVKARGVYQLQAGKYDAAIQTLDSAITMRPDDADAFNSRGNAYASKKDLDRAIQDYDSAITLRPQQPFAYKNRGTAFAAKDDVERAIQDFDKAIALKADFAGAYNSRGFAFQRKGEYERALQDFDKSIQLAPGSAPAFRNRANLHFILGHYAESASDLERALQFYESESKLSDRFNETAAYAVVWLHVAKMRLGQNDSVEFASRSARIDSVAWPRPVVSFFTGKMTADQLVANTANAEERLRNDQRCGAEFFAGQVAMAKKQTAEARKRFEATKTFCSKRYVEHMVAEAELGRLGVAAK
jgi:lipoprotein NlpI